MITYHDPRAPSSAQNEPYELAIDLPALTSGTVAFLAAARDDLAAVLLEPAADGGLVLWIEADLRPHFSPAPGLDAYLTIREF